MKGKDTSEVTSNSINGFLDDPTLIGVDQLYPLILSINSSRFTDNSYMILVSLNPDPYTLHDVRYSVNLTLYVYNTIIRNNSATSVLVEGIQQYPCTSFSKAVIVLKGILVHGNIVINIQNALDMLILDLESSVFNFSGIEEVIIEDSSFSDNQGTPLAIQNYKGQTRMQLNGGINFTNNTGILGGACRLHPMHFMIESNTEGKIVFEGNSALYGGAVYLNGVIIDGECKMQVKFINNTATTSGNSVYFATMPLLPFCSFHADIQRTDIGSPVWTISTYKEERVFSLIPGQIFFINISVLDCFGLPSSCTADAYIVCDNSLVTCSHNNIRLNGPDNLVLEQTEAVAFTEVDTRLSVSAPEMLGNTSVQLLFKCRNDIGALLIIKLNISKCPLSFAYSKSEGVCKCTNKITNNGTVICSEYLGIACIKQGYWYGLFDYDNTKMDVSAQCSYPDCSYSYKPCPAKMLSLGFSGDYKLLGIVPDEQCSVGRGGILCKSCAQGYQYTFLAVSCVASSTCEWWQPYLILVITLVFQLMIAMVLIILIVRFKKPTGSGFLYGPILFLAIISKLPLETDPNLSFLKTSVLIITAVPLLNPEPLDSSHGASSIHSPKSTTTLYDTLVH